MELVNITNDLERRIDDAFSVFDHHSDKTIDVREVGTVLRFLGCAPTETEINEVILATEEEDTRGEIRLSEFLPYVCQALMERKWEPCSPEKLLEAFHVLDPEKKGYLEKEYLSKLMMEEGEPFTKEELDEMMAVAAIEGKIPYEFYMNQLMHHPKDSIYDLAEKILNEQRVSVSPQRRDSKAAQKILQELANKN